MEIYREQNQPVKRNLNEEVEMAKGQINKVIESIDEDDKDSEMPSPLPEDKGKSLEMMDGIYSSKVGPQLPSVKTPFDTKFEFDEVPSTRQVVHRQTILV